MLNLYVSGETDDWFGTERPPNRLQGRIDGQRESDNEYSQAEDSGQPQCRPQQPEGESMYVLS